MMRKTFFCTIRQNLITIQFHFWCFETIVYEVGQQSSIRPLLMEWPHYILEENTIQSVVQWNPHKNLPTMVIEGFNLPSWLNNGWLSVLAKGLLGLGSLGVPSTLVQSPTLEFMPMTACMTKLLCPCITHLSFRAVLNKKAKAFIPHDVVTSRLLRSLQLAPLFTFLHFAFPSRVNFKEMQANWWFVWISPCRIFWG